MPYFIPSLVGARACFLTHHGPLVRSILLRNILWIELNTLLCIEYNNLGREADRQYFSQLMEWRRDENQNVEVKIKVR